MVCSRCGHRLPWHPSISRSISPSVRYSRVLTSAFLGRRGVTFRFTVSGDTILRTGFGIRNNAPAAVTFSKVTNLRKVCKQVHGAAPAATVLMSPVWQSATPVRAGRFGRARSRYGKSGFKGSIWRSDLVRPLSGKPDIEADIAE